jgi:hypothetical protein
MSDIMVKVMTEVLNVLALVTKHLRQGRFSTWLAACLSSPTNRCTEKFIRKLLGERRIEAVLQRLDQLTQEEALMTGAHTLEVVHGLSDDLKVVRDGAKFHSGRHQMTDETCTSRWQDINTWYTPSSRYVQPTWNTQSSYN